MVAASTNSPTAPVVSQVALVIGSGGIKCAAALGVVKALADAGIGIERVIGCSTGAIFAALVALGYPLDQSKALTLRLWPRELASRRGVLGQLLAATLHQRAAEGTGLERGDHRLLPRLLATTFGERCIQDTAVPLHLTATDYATGELVELAAGPLVEGICASLALPPAGVPQRVGGRLLVDGALSDPLPVSVAIKHGARAIVAVGIETPLQQSAQTGRQSSTRLYAILGNNLLRAKLAFHGVAHHAEMITVFPEFKRRGPLFDTDKLAWVLEEGEQAALQQLPYLHQLLAQGVKA